MPLTYQHSVRVYVPQERKIVLTKKSLFFTKPDSVVVIDEVCIRTLARPVQHSPNPRKTAFFAGFPYPPPTKHSARVSLPAKQHSPRVFLPAAGHSLLPCMHPNTASPIFATSSSLASSFNPA